MYITADENTNGYFERFKTIKILDPRYNSEKTWQVVGVDPYYGDGILQVFLDEYFENPIADIISENNASNDSTEEPIDENSAYISGPIEVRQYSKAYYRIHNVEDGVWYIKIDNQEKILDYNF